MVRRVSAGSMRLGITVSHRADLSVESGHLAGSPSSIIHLTIHGWESFSNPQGWTTLQRCTVSLRKSAFPLSTDLRKGEKKSLGTHSCKTRGGTVKSGVGRSAAVTVHGVGVDAAAPSRPRTVADMCNVPDPTKLSSTDTAMHHRVIHTT